MSDNEIATLRAKLTEAERERDIAREDRKVAHAVAIRLQRERDAATARAAEPARLHAPPDPGLRDDEDRDRAYAWLSYTGTLDAERPEQMAALAESFAEHRHDSIATIRERADRYRALLERIVKAVDNRGLDFVDSNSNDLLDALDDARKELGR